MSSPAEIPVGRPCFSPQTRRAIAADLEKVLASGQLVLGEFTERAERQYAELTRSAHAVAVNTGTTALVLCLRHLDLRGGEVLVPSASFVTDIAAVLEAGGVPVLVDINPETLAFDLEDLARKVSARTRAIIWVHLTGIISPEYREIVAFARAHDLFLIEDAAHAHGAEIDGRPAGSLGDAACFSFYATKIVAAGTGGMIVTDDADLVRFAREMRGMGRNEDTGKVVRISGDYLLDEVRACIVHHHTKALPTQLARRRAIAARYRERLGNQPGLRLFDLPRRNLPAYYQFAVALDRSVDGDALIASLREKHSIHCKRIYTPTHREPAYRRFDDGTLRATEDILTRALCLPMFTALTDRQVDRVADSLVGEIRAQR